MPDASSNGHASPALSVDPILARLDAIEAKLVRMEPALDTLGDSPGLASMGRLILAEFDYDGNVDKSFPFDTSQERYSIYVLKKDLLPNLYWHWMLQGRA